MDNLKDDKFKFWKISLNNISYYKEKDFNIFYSVNNFEIELIERVSHCFCVYLNEDKSIINTSFKGDDD